MSQAISAAAATPSPALAAVEAAWKVGGVLFFVFRRVSALLDVSQLLRVPDFGFTDVLRHHDGYAALPRPEIF